MRTYYMPSLLTPMRLCRDTLFATFNIWGRWALAYEITPEYIDGNGKPHYQVPATRTTVEIFPDRVILWDMSKPIDHGRMTYLSYTI
jgi:hypothetical protein